MFLDCALHTLGNCFIVHLVTFTLISVSLEDLKLELSVGCVPGQDDGVLFPKVPLEEVPLGGDVLFTPDVDTLEYLLEGEVDACALDFFLLFKCQLVVWVKVVSVGLYTIRFTYGHISGLGHFCA